MDEIICEVDRSAFGLILILISVIQELRMESLLGELDEKNMMWKQSSPQLVPAEHLEDSRNSCDSTF